MDEFHGCRAHLVAVSGNGILQLCTSGENAPGKQPAGNVVLRPEPLQEFVRNRRYDVLGALQVGSPRHLPVFGVGHHEISETELHAYILAEFVGEGLGPFHYESGMHAFRDLPHALLGGLHENRHLGHLAAYHLAEVHAGVKLLVGGFVPAVEDETYVGDYAQHLLLEPVEQGNSVVVVRGHQDFRTCALAEDLLLLVEGVLQRRDILLENKLVEQRQIGGIVADGVFDQQYALHAAFQYVLLCIHAVFQQLDDGYYEVGGTAPAEGVIYAAAVAFLKFLPDFFRIRGEKHYRGIRSHLLHPRGEVEDVYRADVVHCDDQIETFPVLHHTESVGGRFGTFEYRRIGEIELGILARNAHVEPAVLFQGEIVVIVAHKQDSAYAPAHQCNCFGHRDFYQTIP